VFQKNFVLKIRILLQIKEYIKIGSNIAVRAYLHRKRNTTALSDFLVIFALESEGYLLGFVGHNGFGLFLCKDSETIKHVLKHPKKSKE